MMKDPGPEGLLADADAGFVRRDGGAGQQALLDPVGLNCEGRRAVLQQVGERPFAHLQPEQVAQQAFEALERNRLTKAQIQDERTQVGAERRTRLQSDRWRRLKPGTATRADTAMQRHPRYIGRDLRDLDPVVGLDRDLGHAGHIGMAMGATICQHLAPARRVGVQRPVRPGMRLALRLRLALGVRLAALARRRARVFRRLRRQVQLLPQRRVFRLQRRHARQQRGDQRILLGRRKQREIRGWSHRIVESRPDPHVNKISRLVPIGATMTSAVQLTATPAIRADSEQLRSKTSEKLFAWPRLSGSSPRPITKGGAREKPRGRGGESGLPPISLNRSPEWWQWETKLDHSS